jgi:hypothetical protein
VAVALRAGGFGGCEIAAGAGLVLNHNGLAKHRL